MRLQSPPSALRADAARNRERIVAAAAEVFAERGLDAATAEIAHRAGVGEATLFRRFPHKDELIDAIIETRMEEIAALADAAADDPEVEMAHYGSLNYFIDAIAKHIEREVDAGNMLPCNPYETARALAHMNNRYMTSVLGRDPQVEPEVVVDTICTIWTRTLYGAQP